MIRYRWIKNQRYYYYDVFESWDDALAIAKEFREKNKRIRHYIKIIVIDGQDYYELYLNKILDVMLNKKKFRFTT